MSWRTLRDSASRALQRVSQHPLVRAAAGFATMTAIVKAVAFFKEAVVASVFGVGSSMDSYLMALAVIGFPSGVLLNAAQTVLVRDYVRAAERDGEHAARAYLRGAALVICAALTVVLIAWLAALPAILSLVGHGMDAAQRARVTQNIYWLLPYYYLSSLNLLGYGALQARKSFVRSALIPIATPAIILALLAVAGAQLAALIGLLVLGTAIESVCILVALGRAPRAPARAAQAVRPWTRAFIADTLTLMPGTLVGGLSPLIEQTIASGLGAGAISALGYAAKLPATLNSLFVTAVGVTVLPYFSQRLARGYDAACRRFFIRYVVLVALVGLGVSIVAVLASHPFVRVAFQHGRFSAQSAWLVTALQQSYLWQLPGALAAIVAIRFAAAQGRYRMLTFGNLLMVPITGLLQWRLSILWGAPGLAFGTSLGYAVSAVIFVWLALRPPLGSLQ